jgi:hypothetical protein
MALWGSVVVSLLAGSSAPTALYATYERQWGYGAVTTTVVFAVYGVAVLAGLLVLGRLSDHLGRRPVTLTALAVQVVAMGLFATAGDVDSLLVARIVQGVATGAAVTAVGAAVLDLDSVRGAVANSVGPGLGTALGALLSGVLVAYLPAPTHLIYLALIVVFLAQAVGITALEETGHRSPGAWRSLRPGLSAPSTIRPVLLPAVAVVFAVWALAGFYASVGPQLTAEVIGRSSPLWGGVVLFVLTATAAVAALLTRRLPARRVLQVGVLAVTAGLATVVLAISTLAAAPFVLGTLVAGVGFGTGFQGAVRLVVPRVRANDRAGTLAVLYVAAYLGLALPSVAAGVAVVETGDVLAVGRGFALAVVALTLAALLGLTRRRLPTTCRTPHTPAAPGC